MLNGIAQAALAQLALSEPRRLSRDRLAGALWGARTDEQARQALRQSLRDLRRALGADAGFLNGGRLEVSHGALAVDAPELTALLNAART